MRGLPVAIRWALLVVLSVILIWVIELIRLPAAALLGAMIAGMIVATNQGQVVLPRWVFLIAQGFIGCLMARAITREIVTEMYGHWPLFLASGLAVIAICSGLGLAMARSKMLPGTTAIWGSSPGASSVMVLMAEAYGGDIRLVAFMQFLRMVMVAAVGSIIARLWIVSDHPPPITAGWFDSVPAAPFAATVAIALTCAAVGARSKLPGGPVLLALVSSTVLQVGGATTITLPPLLLLVCYAIFGWFIGLRFTREIVIYAARLTPRIIGAIFGLICGCAALAYVVHLITGVDMLTAYFATSPGGADSVAIIASSSQVDLPFVMAMQITRFLLVLALGPWVARASVRWIGRKAPEGA